MSTKVRTTSEFTTMARRVSVASSPTPSTKILRLFRFYCVGFYKIFSHIDLSMLLQILQSPPYKKIKILVFSSCHFLLR